MQRLLAVLIVAQVCAFVALLAEWGVRRQECLDEIGLKFGGSYHGREADLFTVRCHVTAQGAEFSTTTGFSMLPAFVAACGLLVCLVVTLVIRNRLMAEGRRVSAQDSEPPHPDSESEE
ncbi:hypothetical protein VT50_0210650 [Streptomyces antioxidans]|uniref:Uncharacterized protein n=1 Tax=Streptomyces antioxidans TaxID=1507734 RepID=A0A1V4D7M9_9ACTN|nr:hypothetical protein [Streptomyces antioxidans]OPF80994.1 hypothetical protein VT50_0210650 [Streptomyces antioxidans]